MDKRQGLAWISAMVFGVLSTAAPTRAFSADPQDAFTNNTDKPRIDKAHEFAAEAERLRAAGKFQQALPFAQRALVLREKALGPRHVEVGRALHALGVLYKELGEYVRAAALMQRSLEIRELVYGLNHMEIAAVLHDLGEVYWYNGEYARAKVALQRTITIRQKCLGPHDATIAASLEGLSLIARAMGEPIHSEMLAEKALDLVTRAGITNNELANALDVLAWSYRDRGDYVRAEEMLRRSLVIHESDLGPNHPRLARTLDLLTFLYITQGDYTRAQEVNQRAAELLEQAFGPLHPQRGYNLNYLAMLCEARGDQAQAEVMFQRALQIWEKTLAPNHPHIAYSLLYLARLYHQRGDHVQARPLAERAIALSESAFGPKHALVAYTLTTLGTIDIDQGNADAKPRIERALAILEEVFGHDHLNVALPLHQLGRFYEAQGDLARAERLWTRSLAIREKVLFDNHPAVAASLNALTSLHVMQGRFAEALESATRATAIQDHNAHRLLSTGSEDQKRLYMQTLMAQTSQNILLHVDHDPQNPAAARLALSTLLRRKGIVLDVMTDTFTALKRSLSDKDQALLDQLTTVYSQIATQASRDPGPMGPERYRKNLADLEQTRQGLEAEIAKQSPAFRADHQVTIEAVQAAIPQDAVLVEIARVTPSRPMLNYDNIPPLANSSAPSTYVAYLLRPTGEPTFVNLGDAARIDDAITTFRAALSDHDRTHDPKPAARTLDQLLMEPIRALLGDTHWVFVSADGPLHLVPFAALVDEQGHYLVERYLFSYLTSGRDLLRYESKVNAPSTAPLILANPAFDESRAPKALESKVRGLRSLDMVKDQRLLPLESTVEEARTIASLFPDSRVLLEHEATEEAVKDTQSPKFLHLATHGFFLPEQPIPRFLGAGDKSSIPADEQNALGVRENPLLRSGIALAGFHQRQSGRDDGVLTALEMMGLNLHGTRLAVLSTCESGVGEARFGEGIYGLRRALTMAGAETQVMSLWRVDTGYTGQLMQAYYEALSRGRGRSEAMRDAQLAMLRQTELNHPNLWASFIVSGQWRPLEETVPQPVQENPLSWVAVGLLATLRFRSKLTS